MALKQVLTLLFLLGGANAEARERIRIAVSNPNMPNLTVAVAQKKNFLKDEGIEAEIIRMNPNVAVTALAKGNIDYCQLFGARPATRCVIFSTPTAPCLRMD